MPRTHWREDWLPSAINALLMIVTAATAFYLPVFMREGLGFGGTEIGLLFALSSIAGVLAAVPAGLSNDRLSSRTLIVFALLVQAVCLFLMGQIALFALFAVTFFTWSLSTNLYKVSLDVQVMRTQSEAGLNQRVYLYQALRFTGLAAGVIPAGYFLSRFDFSLTLAGIGLIVLLLAVYATTLRPTPVKAVRLADYAADLRRPTVLAFAFWLFLFAAHWGAEATCYGLFLKTDLKLSLQEMGGYFACEYSILGVLFTVLFRKRATFGAEGLKRVAIFGLLLSGLGQMGMVLHPVWLSLAFRTVHGLGDGLMFVIFYLGIARLFAIERVGGNAGFINLCTMLGSVVGSLLSGPIGEAYGYIHPLWISGALTLLLILPLLGRKRNALMRL